VVAKIKPLQTTEPPTVETLTCYPIHTDEVKVVVVIDKPIVVEEVEVFAEKIEDLVDLTSEPTPEVSPAPLVQTCFPIVPPPKKRPKKMAALIVYHDRAYNAIQFQGDFNDDFANTLAAICKITVNTRRYLYSAGITSMEAVVEFFSTHEAATKFIDSVMKKEGKELSIPLYRDPNYHLLRFPLIEQVRLKALQLFAVTHSFCGLPFNLQTLDEATILRFGLFVTTITTGKTTKDMLEIGIPVLSALGNAAENYSVWSDKFVDFMSNFRSCYTGALLNYLLRKGDESKMAGADTYDTLDMFLVASMQFNPAVNSAFIEENKLLAAVLSCSLGGNNPYATDIIMLLGKGQGRAAWTKLKVRVNGTAIALFARVQILELKLKAVYDGSAKGGQAIQNHSSSFVKTVQDLANAGSMITHDCQIRDYLTTLQDPILLALKDSIRADGGALTLDEAQQKFVDSIEGRKADALAQLTKIRAIKAAIVKYPKKDKNKTKDFIATGNNRKKWDDKKRKAAQVKGKLTTEEIVLLKISNPDDWF
jgi:hypothetical protein